MVDEDNKTLEKIAKVFNNLDDGLVASVYALRDIRTIITESSVAKVKGLVD